MTDKTYWDKLGRSYQYWKTPILEFVAGFVINNGNSVLEGSVGTGTFVRVLREIGFKGEYLGSDYCDSFIGHAKSNQPNEEFVKIDLFKPIPLKDKSFDIFYAHHGFDYIYPYKPALEELKRVCKKFVIIDFWRPFGDWNSIRFTEKEGWNVNEYDKKEWYDTIKELGYKIYVDAEITDWNFGYNKHVYNHLFILEI